VCFLFSSGSSNCLLFFFLTDPIYYPDLMLSDWVSFLAYPNLFGIKGVVVVDPAYYPVGK
jgi:hypothetical protein